MEKNYKAVLDSDTGIDDMGSAHFFRAWIHLECTGEKSYCADVRYNMNYGEGDNVGWLDELSISVFGIEEEDGTPLSKEGDLYKELAEIAKEAVIDNEG